MKNYKNNILNNTKNTTTGFSCPQNYFENIENKILEKEFKPKTGFKTPSNYFENLDNKIYLKAKPTKVILLKNYINIKSLAFAAAASLLLFFSLYNFNPKDNLLSMHPISTSEIDTWLDNDFVSFDTYDISDVFSDTDLDIIYNNEAEDLLYYLDYTDLESLIINN